MIELSCFLSSVHKLELLIQVLTWAVFGDLKEFEVKKKTS